MIVVWSKRNVDLKKERWEHIGRIRNADMLKNGNDQFDTEDKR